MIPLQKAFFIVITLICSSVVVSAVTLQAKVVDVRSGNTLVVSNINRSVRVRLISVAPPETGQPFSDAAREHLRTLVLDKTVTVEYRHLTEGYLEAKVLLNSVDIGSQMLRDGVAWYDHTSDYELIESDRDLYAQCEQAARVEKRGLWQDASPVSPWEYRRAEQAKKVEMVYGGFRVLAKARLHGKTSLSNGDLMGALMGGPGSATSLSGLRPIVENGSFDRWTSFESPIAKFSVMIPSNGVQGSTVASDPNGRPVAFDMVLAAGDREFLALLSGKGYNDYRTDAAALDKAVRDLSTGMNQQAALHGDAISIKLIRDLKLSGFLGRQYGVTCNAFSGTIRLFTRQNKEARQLFVLFALARPGGEAKANQFLNSFKITE